MTRRSRIPVLACGLLCFTPGLGAELTPPARPALAEAYGSLPLSFEVNAGQLAPGVDFVCRSAGLTLFLSRGEAVLSLRGAGGSSPAVVRMTPVGATRPEKAPRPIGLERQVTKTNYLLGSDPANWRTDVANFARVRYPEVYPGIDLVFHGNQRRLEYDLVLAPGADSDQIRLAFSGADAVELDPQGQLVLHTVAGDLVQPVPVIYQEAAAGAKRTAVEGRYVLLASTSGADLEPRGRREVGFALGTYDRTRPLVIDPVIVYTTFLGSATLDQANGIAVDGAGDAYVTGYTLSPTFLGVVPGSMQAVAGGSSDAFVTKINAAGTAIVYSTFLGGSSIEQANGIAVDGAGNAYVTGYTGSASFPGVSASSAQAHIGGSADAFVTKINPAGTAIVYSTYLGGSGDEIGQALALDSAGNAYVTGVTSSSSFPGASTSSIQAHSGGAGDGFVTKINAAGTAIVYSSFLGGSDLDGGRGIGVETSGAALVTGYTRSPSFPGIGSGSIQAQNAGGFDGFVTKINAAGTATLYSSFLGGSGDEIAYAVAQDGAGNAYITGGTSSPTFRGVTGTSLQAANHGETDCFVTKINAAGSAIVYSTFLGGSGSDAGYAIAVDGVGAAYVTGATTSTNFPGVTVNSLQPTLGGALDAFVTKINATGTAFAYSTYLGGSNSDQGNWIAVNANGNALVTGVTQSVALPGTTGSLIQAANRGNQDGFVTRIDVSCGGDLATSLCLGDGRFRVTATYDAGGGNAGSAKAVRLTSDTGYLWFFSSTNVEAVVKVLNACGLNQRYWVFAGGLTDVNVELTVTDTKTGAVATYTNPPHSPFQPIQDTDAFATCP